ncbi:hypothetical protein TNCT_580181 [Trichonephila clavata]|uniref:Uncharacterized protein n=1 Tax=Trichonephila clavata TaxID=2740835 RepID=A0A8X6LR58_TRICU|nr:hypothetical protein TNCT_580181 [Trichonephila clavata]
MVCLSSTPQELQMTMYYRIPFAGGYDNTMDDSGACGITTPERPERLRDGHPRFGLPWFKESSAFYMGVGKPPFTTRTLGGSKDPEPGWCALRTHIKVHAD